MKSSAAKAETLAGGGRGFWRYSVQYFVCCSNWKIQSRHDFLRQQSSLDFPMLRIRSFLYVFKCGPARGYVDRSNTIV